MKIQHRSRMRLRALVRALHICVATAVLAACGSPTESDPTVASQDSEAPAAAAQALPLLDQSSMRSPMMVACENQLDSTPLPVDARSLVVEGMDNKNAAVQLNAYWVDLHNPAAPFLKNPNQRPTTCGQWRAEVASGGQYMDELALNGGAISARAYNLLWRAWGASARPTAFDQEVVLRYGLAPAPFRNPYPLEGEDPLASNGGSGQLPLGLIQLRNDDGQYTGKMSFNCSICHDSEFGTAADGPGFGTVRGRGNDNFDMATMLADFAKMAFLAPGADTSAGVAAGLVPIPLSGTTRGVTDPDTGFEVVSLIRDMDTMDAVYNAKPYPVHTSSGSIDGITWPNMAYRPRKFMGGDLSSDETRSMQALLLSDTDRYGDGATFKAENPAFEQVKTWIESLELPDYPRPIDTAKAEAGAILFHSLDLWARAGNEAIEQPPGNGSCASCHGAYSPRFANDPAILSDPRLRGIAGYMVPVAIVGTDRNRANQVGGLHGDQMNAAWNTSWLGYAELNPEYAGSGQADGGTPFGQFLNDYAVYLGDNSPRLKGPNTWQTTRDVYLAPPLWGVWATAPYLHNGSVPDLWSVLGPAARRPKVWQRRLTKLPGGINTGFDRSLDAYDMDKLGWKYTEIPCDTTGVMAAASCTPKQDPVNRFLAALATTTGPITWLTYLYLPPFTQASVEARTVYNTHLFTQGNQGHDFTPVLTDTERLALIEYLKTL